MRKVILFFCLFLTSFPAMAQEGSQNSDLSKNLSEWTRSVQEIRLKNGLRFLVYPRGDAPIFSAYIRFRVGGMEEEAGKTGLAHFLEHMAFKGTETLGTNDFKKEKPILEEIEKVGEALSEAYKEKNISKIEELKSKLKELHQLEVPLLNKEELARAMLERGGADYNATTSKDMTSYFVSLPADQLRFWAELESQRIFKPIFREFYEERDVVLEERRMRVDNDPDGRLYEAFISKAYPDGPYHAPTIGTVDDILQLTVGDLKRFFEKYYHPSRMIGVLVGKIDPEQARRILEDTFGKIHFNSEKEEESVPSGQGANVVQRTAGQVILKMKAQPRILVGYHKPTLPNDDDLIFDLIDQILGDGRSSRLYRSLVLEKRLATDVETATSIPGARLPNLFMIAINPVPGKSKAVLTALEDEMKKIARDGVSAREVQRAENRLKMDLLREMRTNEGMASQISYFESVAGDWRYLATYLDKKFTPADVRRVAKTYLTPDNRTTAVLESAGESK